MEKRLSILFGLGLPFCTAAKSVMTEAGGYRAAIQENDFIYVWAEGTAGLRSDYYPVKVGWDFVK